MYYAQIDSDGFVVAVTQTSGEINLPTMIQINSLDTSLFSKKYINGVFVDV
jgi:hypothetical protein